ncbi:MAG: chloride channel protein [Anaeroplasmataceae bacterium]
MKRIKNILLPTLISFLVGILCGTVIFFYRFIAEYITKYSKICYSHIRNNLILLLILIPAILLASLIVTFLVTKAPAAKGGGIPTSEGIIKGSISFSWIKSLPALIVSSYLSFFFGLPLGVEGPSVEIGTCLGKSSMSLAKKNKAYDRYIMTGGAASAFACATGAPITGVIFALEEIHKRFSTMILLVSVSAVTSGCFVAYMLADLFNVRFSLFNIDTSVVIKYKDYGYIILFAIIVGLIAFVFSKLIHLSQIVHDKYMKKCHLYIKVVISFTLSAISSLILIDTIGGGHSLILSVIDNKYGILLLILFLFIKLILIAFVSQSGATGGLFIPTLLIGALTGAIFAKIFKLDNYSLFFIAMGMSSFMTATIGCPLSGMVFSIEGLGMINNLIPAVIVIFICYITSKILNIKPMYDEVLERKLKNDYKNKNFKIIECDFVVNENSFASSMQLRDLLLPVNCVVISIQRKAKHHFKMDNSGDKIIYSGDIITLRCQTYDVLETKDELESLLGIQQEFNYKLIQEKRFD